MPKKIAKKASKKTSHKPTNQVPKEVDQRDLTIIGIGSSAGGLEAIREFVSSLPSDLPVSYVVVQHLSPHHKSLMTELVARETKLTVQEVEDGILPKPNVIYITPHRTDVIYDGKTLRLVDPSPEPASPKPSVDRFLQSLAEHHGAKTMAIILSGTGSDGAYGVRAIREAGGITIAQDGESSKYDGMPVSAVQTGCVDLVLGPQEIGTHLKKILSSPKDFKQLRQGEFEQTPVSDLLQVLLARSRVDFREYKQTTIMRRIERRMVALGIDSHDDYTQFCRANPDALDDLFNDLLISVTRFFRDKDEFGYLKEILPNLLENAEGRLLRVWVAGCATGEEAYSIAMMLSEALGGAHTNLKDQVQVFATDLNKDVLKVARRGVYGITALNEIPRDLADKYLIREKETVRVVDSLKAAILFSEHNVCQDPPFQKVDLLCCRNLLIYFGNNLQKKVMSRFHYSLRDDAVMMLGTAESVAGSDELFVTDQTSQHFYRKRMISRQDTPSYARALTQQSAKKPEPPSARGDSTDRQMFEALAQSLGDNSILVTEDYSIVRVFGNVSQYIEMHETSSLKVHLDLLKRPLREEARSLITIALKNGKHRAGVKHLLNESSPTELRLDAYPINARQINEKAALLVFNRVEINPIEKVPLVSDIDGDTVATARIRILETEVSNTREALQQTIEEQETSNEELQSLNEELQSTNEELQATNEELETSNEELQSTNEELITVNEELQVTAAELDGRTGELVSVLRTAPLAIMVVDTALQVTQATDASAALFGLTRPVASCHLSQCTLPESYPPLAPICNEALTLGMAVFREFSTGGTRVKIDCAPFFNTRGKILGITLVVSEFPGLAKELELILDQSQFYMMRRAEDGTILRISKKSANVFGLSREEAEGQNIYELSNSESEKYLRKSDQELYKNKHKMISEVHSVTPKGSGKTVWMSAERSVIDDDHEQSRSIYAIGTDVTELMHAKEQAETALTQLHLLQNMASVGYWSVDLKAGSLHWSEEVFRIHGLKGEEYTPELETAINFYHPDDVEDVRKAVETAIGKGGEFRFTKRIIRPDGKSIKVQSFGLAKKSIAGEVSGIIGVFRQL